MTPALTPASGPAGADGPCRTSSAASEPASGGVDAGAGTGGRRVRLAAALVLTGTCGLLAACGTTPAPGAAPTKTVTIQASPAAPGAPPTQPVGSTPVSQAGPPGCLANGLQASLGAGQGTAGTLYQVVVLTNKSASTCTLYGYPGVSFVTGEGGSTVGAPATRNPVDPTTLVTLAPGGQANMLLGVHDAGAYPPSACQPTSVDWLRIYPPGDYGSDYVQYQTQTCSNAAEQILTTTPMRAGAGSASA